MKIRYALHSQTDGKPRFEEALCLRLKCGEEMSIEEVAEECAKSYCIYHDDLGNLEDFQYEGDECAMTIWHDDGRLIGTFKVEVYFERRFNVKQVEDEKGDENVRDI